MKPHDDTNPDCQCQQHTVDIDFIQRVGQGGGVQGSTSQSCPHDQYCWNGDVCKACGQVVGLT
jgi:hypothetical protein